VSSGDVEIAVGQGIAALRNYTPEELWERRRQALSLLGETKEGELNPEQNLVLQKMIRNALKVLHDDTSWVPRACVVGKGQIEVTLRITMQQLGEEIIRQEEEFLQTVQTVKSWDPEVDDG
jgi:hypothetical protein